MPDRRILSIDVFRGLAVAGMVLVNNPGTWGAVYAPLRHADWHGWTPTDLIFPFFLFIVGVAIPLALGRRLGEGLKRGDIVRRILRRSAVIFALGFILHAVSNFDAATIRIPGVLQRIAVCYLVAALFFVFTGWRVQAGAAVIALLGYWALLTLVPVPGFGPGDLGKEGNLAAWLDRALLGPHIWRLGRVYDPEGILSTPPAIATTLFGVLTGHFIRAARSATAAVRGLVIGGAAAMAIGLGWARFFPINKSLWTSSYAVFMAGMAMNCFAVSYWLVDVQGWRRWAKPFAIYGMNAIAVFMLSGLLGRILPAIKVTSAAGKKVGLQAYLYDSLFVPFASPDTAPFLGCLASPKNASLMWALIYCAMLYLVAYGMYRRKWFLKF